MPDTTNPGSGGGNGSGGNKDGGSVESDGGTTPQKDSGGSGSASVPSCDTFYGTCCPDAGGTTSSCANSLSAIKESISTNPSSAATYESSCKNSLDAARDAGTC